MKDAKEWFKIAMIILVIIAIITGVVAFTMHQKSADHRAIEAWHASQNEDVIEIDKPWFNSGPYWLHDDDDRIYRATVRGKNGQRYCWHKFNIWGHAKTYP